MSLWSRVRYLNPISCIIGSTIREYDISKANISVLLDKGAISQQEYERLYSMEKSHREISIGIMQRDTPGLSRLLSSGIAEARKIFLQTNQIPDENILSIKNDAIVVVGNIPIRTTMIFPHTGFRLANSYTSYYNLNNIEVYYQYNQFSLSEVFDVKGIGDDRLELHKEYMVSFLSSLFYTAELNGIRAAIDLLESFHDQYINYKLDLGFYRPFEVQSMYKINIGSIDGLDDYRGYYADHWSSENMDLVDISYNEYLLRLLYSYYMKLFL